MGVSALLKSAQATQAKIQAANDAEVSYEWQSSAQTYDDYLAYHGYLDAQAAKTTDPTKQLAYATTQRSALRSYQSNEIQRTAQQIQEGSATIQDKQQLIENLVGQAQAIGDDNQVQNLISQWDSLSIQAQNEAKAAAASSRASASEAATAYKNQLADMVDANTNLMNTFVGAINQSGTPKDAAANIAAINAQLPPEQQIPADAGVFDIAASYVDTMKQLYQSALQQSPDITTSNDIAKLYNKFEASKPLELPTPDGGSIKLGIADIQKQIALANVGQSLVTESNGPGGKTYIQNKVDNYQFGHDQNGNVVAIPTYSASGTSINQKVTDLNGNPVKGKNGKQADYQALLENAGFRVINNGGVTTIQDTTGQNRLNGADTAQIHLTKDGQLQFVQTPTGTIDPNSPFQDNQVFDLAFDKSGNFSGTTKEIANPFVTQYDANYRGNDTPYFQAHQGQAQQAFGTAGILTPQTIAKFNLDVGTAGTVRGGGLTGGLPQFSSPTNVLQNATLRQAATQTPFQAPQIQTAPIPQIQAPSIAQSLISSTRNSTISIAPPTAPAANISIAPQAPTGKLTGVSTAVPKFNISF